MCNLLVRMRDASTRPVTTAGEESHSSKQPCTVREAGEPSQVSSPPQRGRESLVGLISSPPAASSRCSGWESVSGACSSFAEIGARVARRSAWSGEPIWGLFAASVRSGEPLRSGPSRSVTSGRVSMTVR